MRRKRRVSDDEVFAKMDSLMREKKLFLQRHLTREDMAREVLTNRTHITRALKGRGLNFSQFVNAYRAQYAIDLMLSESHRDTPPQDIAEMSGFSHVDTMNRYIKRSAGSSASLLRDRIDKY